MSSPNAIEWCCRYRSCSTCREAMTWLALAKIETMDEAWACCHRPNWMLKALGKCHLNDSAKRARLEFAARCVDRALTQERLAGREPGAQSWAARDALWGWLGKTVELQKIKAACSDALVAAYHLPHDLDNFYSAYAAAMAAGWAAAAAYSIDDCQILQVSSLVIKRHEPASKEFEQLWQADLLRTLLQPEGSQS